MAAPLKQSNNIFESAKKMGKNLALKISELFAQTEKKFYICRKLS